MQKEQKLESFLGKPIEVFKTNYNNLIFNENNTNIEDFVFCNKKISYLNIKTDSLGLVNEFEFILEELITFETYENIVKIYGKPNNSAKINSGINQEEYNNSEFYGKSKIFKGFNNVAFNEKPFLFEWINSKFSIRLLIDYKRKASQIILKNVDKY